MTIIVDKKEWVVIGAGPAGIAVVGKLLDKGINEIGWIDPNFNVGDIGMKWRTVSSNTTVGLFIKFLNDPKSFSYQDCPINFKLNQLSPPDTCLLNEIADPLQWVTDQLKEKVLCFKTMAKNIKKLISDNNENSDYKWEIETSLGNILCKNIVLAIGAEPMDLFLENKPKQQISVDEIVNMDKLIKVCDKDDTVAVFGSSHTAIIALYNLNLIGCKIINFYRSPLKYAVYYDDWILYDNTGLKGYSAKWAKENIEDKLISNLERVQINDLQFNDKLSTCNKVIYAVGFERCKSIEIESNKEIKYNNKNGIIDKGLFGIGIGFPQEVKDRYGNVEYNVGLWKFMVYLNEILPTWFENNNK